MALNNSRVISNFFNLTATSKVYAASSLHRSLSPKPRKWPNNAASVGLKLITKIFGADAPKNYVCFNNFLF